MHKVIPATATTCVMTRSGPACRRVWRKRKKRSSAINGSNQCRLLCARPNQIKNGQASNSRPVSSCTTGNERVPDTENYASLRRRSTASTTSCTVRTALNSSGLIFLPVFFCRCTIMSTASMLSSSKSSYRRASGLISCGSTSRRLLRKWLFVRS